MAQQRARATEFDVPVAKGAGGVITDCYVLVALAQAIAKSKLGDRTGQLDAGIIEEVMCRFEFLQRKVTESTAAAAAHTAAATAAGRLVSQATAALGRSKEVLMAENELLLMGSLLTGLLSNVPGQLNPQFAADTVTFCVDGLNGLGQER